MFLSSLSNATTGWTDHQHLDNRYASNAPAEVVCENKQPSSEDRVTNHAAPNTSPSPGPMDTQRLVDPSLANALDKLDAWAKEVRPEEDREDAKKEIEGFLENPGATKIILNFSHLSSLPDIFGEQRFKDRLEELDLWGNKLTQLPDGIWQLQNLEILDLSENQFTQLPDEISQLRNLKDLNLFGNYLRSLPDGISLLRNLKVLDLSDNYLTSLPDGISLLRNLKVLDLSGNQLTSLPDGIWLLKKLKNLGLANINLSSLSEKIGGLQKLEILYLSGNKLTSLPAAITQLNTLKDLYLDLENEKELQSLPNNELTNLFTHCCVYAGGTRLLHNFQDELD